MAAGRSTLPLSRPRTRRRTWVDDRGLGETSSVPWYVTRLAPCRRPLRLRLPWSGRVTCGDRKAGPKEACAIRSCYARDAVVSTNFLQTRALRRVQRRGPFRLVTSIAEPSRICFFTQERLATRPLPHRG